MSSPRFGGRRRRRGRCGRGFLPELQALREPGGLTRPSRRVGYRASIRRPMPRSANIRSSRPARCSTTRRSTPGDGGGADSRRVHPEQRQGAHQRVSGRPRNAEWRRRAAELGSSAGMVDLGYLYAHGKGVEQTTPLPSVGTGERSPTAMPRAARGRPLCGQTHWGVWQDDDPHHRCFCQRRPQAGRRGGASLGAHTVCAITWVRMPSGAPPSRSRRSAK